MWMKNINRHMSWIDLSLKAKRRKAQDAAAAAERSRVLKKAAPVRSIRLSDRYARRRRAA